MDLQGLIDFFTGSNWLVLLNGFVGELIGAAAVLGGVWWVIRHERKLRQDEALEQAVVEVDRQARAVLKIFVARDNRINRWDAEISDAHYQLVNALVEAIARSKRRERRLHQVLKELLEHIRPEPLKAGDGRGLGAIMKLNMQWLSHPQTIRRRLLRWRRVTAQTLIDSSTLGPSELEGPDPAPPPEKESPP